MSPRRLSKDSSKNNRIGMIIYMRQTIEYMASLIDSKEGEKDFVALLASGVQGQTESGISYLKIQEG